VVWSDEKISFFRHTQLQKFSHCYWFYNTVPSTGQFLASTYSLTHFGLYHCLYLLGHALNKIPGILSCSTCTHFQSACIPAGETSYALSCHFGCCHGWSIRLRSGDCAGHFKTLLLFCLNYFKAVLEVCIGRSGLACPVHKTPQLSGNHCEECCCTTQY